jgi:hypothetical protein
VFLIKAMVDPMFAFAAAGQLFRTVGSFQRFLMFSSLGIGRKFGKPPEIAEHCEKVW